MKRRNFIGGLAAILAARKAPALCIGLRNGMMFPTGGGELPSGYTEVDYITPAASGAYIDLGWYPTTWTAFEAYMTIAQKGYANFGVSSNSTAHQPQGFSLLNTWANDRYWGFKQCGTNEWSEGYTTTSQQQDIRNNIHHHVINIDRYISRTDTSTVGFEYSVDDALIKTGFWGNLMPSGVSTYTPIAHNVYLFAVNVNGVAKAHAITKMGRLRFYTAEGDVANFIPCLDPSNNAGMYNTITQTFQDAASGTINYGSTI